MPTRQHRRLVVSTPIQRAGKQARAGIGSLADLRRAYEAELAAHGDEIAAEIVGAEVPICLGVHLVSVVLPGGDFPAQGLLVGNAPIETLASQHTPRQTQAPVPGNASDSDD